MKIKFFEDEIDAKRNCRKENKKLDRKVYSKYFKVVIEGPDDNYAVVPFSVAIEMGVAYGVYN